MEPECIPCMLRQALREATQTTLNPEKIKKALRASMEALLRVEWEGPPTLIAQEVHKAVRATLQVYDPYAKIKRESNEIALKFYPKAKELVQKAEDKLEMAVRLSIAGNVLDYAALESPDLNKAIDSILRAKFAINHYPLLKKDVYKARRLTFFADNAGEIVFDRLLIETMEEVRGKGFDEIILAVKGGPIVNDAMEEDVKQAGLVGKVRIVKLSNGEPGTGIERKPEAIKFILSDLNIMKGQGNFEAFSQVTEAYFIMMVKCPVIARMLGVKMGQPVLLRPTRPSRQPPLQL